LSPCGQTYRFQDGSSTDGKNKGSSTKTVELSF
jgi:hypothetical protein